MFKWFVKKINNKKGFTLVELVVVIAILGIISAIAVPKLSVSKEKAERAAVEANLRTIDGAISMYEVQEGELVEGDTIGKLTGKTLQAAPKGPGTATYDIAIVGGVWRATVTSTEKVGGKTFSTATVLSDALWE